MSDDRDTEPSTDLSVEANGIDFECLRAGAGDRLALCLHGFPDDAGSMRPVLERLAGTGFTAVAPYTRGYAPTGPAPDGDYPARALGADAVALAEALPEELDTDAGAPVLVGHDWGAVAAYAADRVDPDAFERMATMAVPPGFEALLLEHPRQLLRSWYMWFFQLPDVPERALRWREFALVEFLWGLWSPGWDYPDERIEAVKETFRTEVSSLVGSLLRRDPPSTEDVAPVRTPTLVIAGERDGCIGPEMFEHADEIIEECRVVRVRDAGHFMHQERPDVVGRELVSFLTD
ncbi:alpha/beta hydrolase [Halobacteriales archaeon QS_9_68_42]|nr:MAG: alpha/beta hydrolase [Halobacteriales archaeon QS_9_68_42]